MKRALAIISQQLFGLAFIFSGIVKCIDPIGTSIKLHDYFAVFGLSWLNDWTLFLSWGLCLIEFVIGLNIVFARNLRVFTLLASVFMLVFTPITLYLAIANPVSDCGCFGDAVVMSNWQTFWKNIVLDVFLIIICLNRRRCYQPSRTDIIPIFFYWEVAIAVGLCFVGSNFLPFIDFRPYRPGVNILEAMQTPGATQEIEYRCVYEKDGVREEFALDNLPAEGSGWTFVETLELATSTGGAIKTEEPLIKDFFIFDELGGDLTEEVLGDTAYTFLLLSPSLEIADETYIDRIENLYEYSIEHGYRFYCLTLNDSVQIASWKYRTGAEYDYLYSDATIIETMIRSNPGVMLLKEGTILWKSCLSKLDVDAVTSAKLTEQTYGQINSDNRKTKVFWLVFLMLAPFIVYLPIEKAFLAYKASKASKAQKATDKKKERQSK